MNVKKIIASPATGVIFLFAVAIAASGYLFWQNNHAIALARTAKPTSPKQTAENPDNLVAIVAKLVDLPPTEKPTIATISDKAKIKNQPFFDKAENGDKVLVYQNLKKAIIYRPSTGKIIEIAPVNISNAPTPTGKVAGASTTANTSIVLLNGTTETGLTGKYESEIKSLLPKSKTTKDKADKTDYEKSVIVVVNESAKSEAEQISSKLGISIGETPYGEDLTNRGDIVIIFGADKK